MTEAEESSWMEGRRAAWLNMLQLCLNHLGVDDPVVGQHAWILEHAATLVKLREICGDYGDTDWEDDLFIPDILDKHLYNHLQSGEDDDS